MADNENSINSDLQDLHDSLIDIVSKLSDAIGNAPDSNTVDAITTEISEVNHRVGLVGNLLFTQQTAGVTKAMDKVRAATADVKSAISELEGIKQFVKGVTDFLVLVDKVIDTAKVVLP